jgi:hypothetical protein
MPLDKADVLVRNGSMSAYSSGPERMTTGCSPLLKGVTSIVAAVELSGIMAQTPQSYGL